METIGDTELKQFGPLEEEPPEQSTPMHEEDRVPADENTLGTNIDLPIQHDPKGEPSDKSTAVQTGCEIIYQRDNFQNKEYATDFTTAKHDSGVQVHHSSQTIQTRTRNNSPVSKNSHMYISSSDNEVSMCGRSTPEDVVEIEDLDLLERSHELDELIAEAYIMITTKEPEKARKIVTDICGRLDKFYKSDKDYQYLDYSHYYHGCAELYRQVADPSNAVKMFYRGVLHQETVIAPLHLMMSALLWDELLNSRVLLQEILNIVHRIQLLADIKLEQSSGTAVEVPFCIYNDLMMTFKTIQIQNPSCTGAKEGKLKATLPWLRCLLILGNLPHTVAEICKGVLKEYPDNASILEIWARALLEMGKLDLALRKTESALLYVKNPKQKSELEVLQRDLTAGVRTSIKAVEDSSPIMSWIEGSNYMEPHRNSPQVEKLKENHVKKPHRRPKARKSSLPTWLDFVREVDKKKEKARSSSASPYRDGHIKKKRRRRNTAGSDISSTGNGKSLQQVLLEEKVYIAGLGEGDDHSIESDEEFDVSEILRSSIFDLDLGDPDESSDGESIRNADVESMFEQSIDVDTENAEEGIQEREQHLIIHGAELSPRFIAKCAFQDKKNFYTNSLSIDELNALTRNNPGQFKKCTLKIESAHKAICGLLQPEGDLKEIEISGRSKCGKNFMEDEVVVEILNNDRKQSGVKPRLNKSLKTATAQTKYGKVVGRLSRKRFRDIEHPVFVCGLDELEYHLMRPLDKTVPKLHIFKKHVQNNFQVEVYDYDSSSCDLKFSNVVNINPAQKYSYVFLVVFIRWDAVYPLGAVIKVMRSDGGINSGLKILELQHQVPTTYNYDTVQNVQSIMSTMPEEPAPNLTEGRIDYSESLSVFTIDPKDSKDLDDGLSIQRLPDNVYEVGVHIADVTSYVHKGDAIDNEAKSRATTFYPGHEKRPYHMLPEPLSQNLCSLLPNKKRLALSVFLYFSAEGELIRQRTSIKQTVVKSRRQFSYQDVQDIILGPTVEEETISSDIIDLFRIAKGLRWRRLGDSMHSFPIEVDLLNGRESERLFDTLEAHFLVEEFMILANMTAASLVCSNFRDCALLSCQNAPPSEKVNQWLNDYPRIADVILKLQNTKPTQQRQLKIVNAPKAMDRVVIELQKWIWSCLEQHVADGNYRDAWKLIGSDELHPEQAIALNEWICFQEHAEYRCLGSVKSRKERCHFTLNISPYTHFTSPIRRYADIVTHRLVHAALNKQEVPYTRCETEDICYHINEVSRRAKQYSKQCRALHYGHVLRRNPAMFNGFIETVSDRCIQLCIPGMQGLPPNCREMPLNLLGVSRKPKITTDRDVDRPFDLLTLAWQKRLYSHRGYAPSARGLDEIRVDPHQRAIFQQYSRWQDLLKALVHGNIKSLQDTFAANADYQEGDQLRPCVPACTSTVVDVSSEVRLGAITKHFCEFSMSFNHAQILLVQIGAEPQKGVLVPTPQVLELTDNFKLCLQHTSDPVKYLAKYATKTNKAYPEKYNSIAEYLEVWLSLVRMEAATMAGHDDAIIVNELPVKLNEKDGTFSMTMDFCEDRNIDFSSMSMEFVLHGNEDDENSDEIKYVPSSDFLCLKCRYEVDDVIYKGLKGSPGEQRIWLAHGQVDKIKKMKKMGRIEVHFLLHPSSQSLPPQLMNSERKPKCSVEIMAKPESNRRTEAALLCLDKANGLAQNIAKGFKIPALDKNHLALARRMEVEVAVPGLAWNNSKQTEAIRKALTNRFTLIQGPPGTGKTFTGIKLLYLFTKLNKVWHQEGNPLKQVVFCGPSNKSVDLVARLTKRKLGEVAPRMVRMYGSSHECMDFPIPGKSFSSKSGRAKNRPDKDLQDIALHRLIRKEGKPHADEILAFDKYFQQFRNCPSISDLDLAKTFQNKLKEYKSLLSKAGQEELQHYDVIFCTTAMTTNPKFIRGTKNKIFQCIIDENGMCTEPESLATIIATKAEQVVLIGDHKQLRPVVMCQHTARLGLEKSLFERYSEKAVFLSTQYRMNPRICDFVSAEFYNNKLDTAPVRAWKEEKPLSIWKYPDVPHIFCHVEGEEEYLTVSTEEGNEQSCSNKAEVEKVMQVFRRMIKTEGVNPRYINIISQYNAQCHAITTALVDSGYINGNVNTVVASQGGEWDYVIFSTTRSLPDYKIEPIPTLGWCKQNLGFITDEHQIDVALSRARKGLVIIGNENLLQCHKVWKHLLDHYRKRECVVDAREFPPRTKTRNRRRRGACRGSKRGRNPEYLEKTHGKLTHHLLTSDWGVEPQAILVKGECAIHRAIRPPIWMFIYK
ncbi:helicase with zinc finger domain 2-like [Mizuhopecten yessoensis]|uniref:helicase with zinc finger domain 2-like n=1 Tax=Mizuhopecten yessoensis TaxID=6573 RepID=UPI000B45BABD|nr:helicase with zinc finger domain 2-like [Mizuhopecten yessoensis]XP_021359812.1 helicase with zinc finger domain 2-like [Mizuhopecten yessoensis]